ncbi:MAG: class I SAM-dependent methyltransferase, partial [Polyangiales bacterium]
TIANTIGSTCPYARSSVIPDSYFDSFHTPKYKTRNPVQRFLIRRFIAQLSDMFDATQPSDSVLEIGCGEGFVAGQLSERQAGDVYVGVDLDERDLENLRAKFPNVDARQGSIYDLSFLGRQFDVVVCAEVMEHLEDPQAALAQIVERKPRWVILSVPHEPWFCLSNFARGKNLTRLGNDPEHVNLWGRRGFRNMLDSHLLVERHVTSYPWQLVLARPRQ